MEAQRERFPILESMGVVKEVSPKRDHPVKNESRGKKSAHALAVLLDRKQASSSTAPRECRKPFFQNRATLPLLPAGHLPPQVFISVMAEDSEVSSGRVGTGSGKRSILNPRYQKSLGLFGVYLGSRGRRRISCSRRKCVGWPGRIKRVAQLSLNPKSSTLNPESLTAGARWRWHGALGRRRGFPLNPEPPWWQLMGKWMVS